MNKRLLLSIYSFLLLTMFSCAASNKTQEWGFYSLDQDEFVSLSDLSTGGGVVMIYVNKERLCSCQFDSEMLGKVEGWYPDATFVTVISGEINFEDTGTLPHYGRLLFDVEQKLQKQMQFATNEALLIVFDRDGAVIMGLPLGSQSEEVNQAQKLLLQVSLKGA